MNSLTGSELEVLAATCYGGCRSYTEALLGVCKPPWSGVPETIKRQFRRGAGRMWLEPALELPEVHGEWWREMEMEGWAWGEEYDYVHKLHPWLLGYGGLPVEVQSQYELMRSLVEFFRVREEKLGRGV